jgi:hypothetical protein
MFHAMWLGEVTIRHRQVGVTARARIDDGGKVSRKSVRVKYLAINSLFQAYFLAGGRPASRAAANAVIGHQVTSGSGPRIRVGEVCGHKALSGIDRGKHACVYEYRVNSRAVG